MNFDYMDEAVESICKSLENEPEKWVFETYTFHKIGSSTKYWTGLGSSVTSIFTGGDISEVFSYEQGIKVKRAYKAAREKQASQNQKQILRDFIKKSDLENKKPWYKFW